MNEFPQQIAIYHGVVIKYYWWKLKKMNIGCVVTYNMTKYANLPRQNIIIVMQRQYAVRPVVMKT